MYIYNIYIYIIYIIYILYIYIYIIYIYILYVYYIYIYVFTVSSIQLHSSCNASQWMEWSEAPLGPRLATKTAHALLPGRIWVWSETWGVVPDLQSFYIMGKIGFWTIYCWAFPIILFRETQMWLNFADCVPWTGRIRIQTLKLQILS